MQLQAEGRRPRFRLCLKRGYGTERLWGRTGNGIACKHGSYVGGESGALAEGLVDAGLNRTHRCGLGKGEFGTVELQGFVAGWPNLIKQRFGVGRGDRHVGEVAGGGDVQAGIRDRSDGSQ